MIECKNRFGTRAARRAHPTAATNGHTRKDRRRRRTMGEVSRAVWVRFQKTSRSGTVTNHTKLMIPGGRKV